MKDAVLAIMATLAEENKTGLVRGWRVGKQLGRRTFHVDVRPRENYELKD